MSAKGNTRGNWDSLSQENMVMHELSIALERGSMKTDEVLSKLRFLVINDRPSYLGNPRTWSLFASVMPEGARATETELQIWLSARR
jgi:hypothetical protein